MRLLRRWVLLAALLLAWAGATAVHAQTIEPPTLLIVDMQRIKSESRAGIAIQQESARFREKIRKEIAEREARIREEERELARLRDEMDPATFRNRVRSFEERVSKTREFAQNETRRLQSLLVSAGDRLRSEATRVLAEILSERGGKVLLDASQIVLSAEELDITEEAIARLNQRLPTVPLGEAEQAREN